MIHVPAFLTYARSVLYVKLYYFPAKPAAGVGHIYRHLQAVLCRQLALSDPQPTVAECGVRQAVAKGVTHIQFLLIVISVTYKYTLLIMHCFAIARVEQISGGVLQTQGVGFRQFTAGVHLTVQQMHGSRAYPLATRVHLQDGADLLCPRHLHRRTAVQHHRHVFLYRTHCLDHFILAGGQAHIRPVVAFALECFRQARENNGYICLCRGSHGLFLPAWVRFIVHLSKAGYVSNARNIPCLLQSIGQAEGVYTGAAAALKMRFFRKAPNKHHLLPCGQGQQCMVIFQQHSRSCSGLHRQGMVPLTVKVLPCGLGRIAQQLFHHTLGHLIQNRLIQSAGTHRSHQLPVRNSPIARHF